jgi:hypothetical protein
VRAEGVSGLERLFDGRGLLHDGSKQVQKWFADGLAAREADMWFDLGWCSGPKLDPDALSAMLRTTTSCDVIQELETTPRKSSVSIAGLPARSRVVFARWTRTKHGRNAAHLLDPFHRTGELEKRALVDLCARRAAHSRQQAGLKF